MSRNYGFSIIELMIAVAIMSILMAIALPAFSDYMRNVKVRTEVEALVSGVQLARAEAVRRNAPVEFLLTAAAPTEANVAAVAVATGPNWLVRTQDQATFIEGRAAPLSAGASAVRVNDTTSPASDDPDAPPGTPVSSIVFNGLGRVVAGAADATFKFTIPGLKCQTDGGPVRCLRATVTVFGQTRLCDPRAVAGDPRSC